MPYFYDPNLDPEKDKASGLQLSSASRSIDPTGESKAEGAGPRTPTGQNRFQNLDAYLQNNNAQAMGQNFGNQLKSEIGKAQSAMDEAAQKFQSTVNASGVTADASKIDQALADPTKADAKEYQSWMNTEYKGPKNLEEDSGAWNQYWGGAQSAKNSTQLAGTESGRFALLDKYYGRPSYSFGEKTLDNLLIQKGGGLNDLKSIQDQSANLFAGGSKKVNDLNSYAAQRAGEVERTRKKAREAIGLDEQGKVKGGALGKLQDDVTQRAKLMNESMGNIYGDILMDVGDDQLNDATLRSLGLNEGENLYDLNLANYIQKGKPITVENAATADDYTRYLALSQLAGIDPTFLTEQGRSNAQVLGAPVSFDRGAFQRDQQARSKILQDNYDRAKAAYDEATHGLFYGGSTVQEFDAAEAAMKQAKAALDAGSPRKVRTEKREVDRGLKPRSGIRSL